MGFLGIFVFLLIGFLLSSNRNAIHWRTIVWGVVLQWLFAFVVLKGAWIQQCLSFLPFPQGAAWMVAGVMCVPMLLRRFAGVEHAALNFGVFALVCAALLRGNLVGAAFDKMRLIVQELMQYAAKGSLFVFGNLADPASGYFAFSVLPVIIFVASIFAVLYHAGVMEKIVEVTARGMGRFLKISGAESVSVAASILMGQTEAPLTIRPFLSALTQSELMVIMTAGMAHVSGSIMVAYVQMAHVDIVHLLTAVIMTAPGAIVMAKLMVPETDFPKTAGSLKVRVENQDANFLDAAARGAFEGGQLAFNVGVMLVAFIGLVALLNGALNSVFPGSSLEGILGVLFKPFAMLMGVSDADAGLVGSLLGKRMVLNEFVAFGDLGKLPAESISQHSRTIATFALCGFANFSSIAVQLGGIGALIPERRGDLARLGLRAMVAGTLANFLSACIAGILDAL
jgi:CNT family concentrative nucleoside transporter